MRDRNGPRPAKPITPRRLENIALAYLQRFASSSENLRRVLLRRIDKAIARGWDGDRAQAAGWVDDVAAKMARLGYLDDATYARARAQSQLRRGRPLKVITADLAARGVAPEHIDMAIEALREQSAEADIAAAIAYARRRRLGPYRADPDERARHRRRDLAALARAGFSYDHASRVLDADSAESLESDSV